MKRLIMILLGISSAAVPEPPAPRDERSDTAAIVQLLNHWGEAMSRRDAAALGLLLTDDFTLVSPRGRLMQKTVYVKNRDSSGVFIEQSWRFDDVAVRFYGETAVATSRYTSKSQFNEKLTGVTYDTSGQYERTDTLLKAGGRWRAAATQLTPIEYPGAHALSETGALHGIEGNQLTWSDSPIFPGARSAVLYGKPYFGGYALRVRRSDGHVEQPHQHESDEHVSVISGVVHIGVGESLDRAGARTFRAGSYVVIPARTVHFSWAEGEAAEDVYWTGPAPRVEARPAGGK